jgi:hypothetical protein
MRPRLPIYPYTGYQATCLLLRAGLARMKKLHYGSASEGKRMTPMKTASQCGAVA